MSTLTDFMTEHRLSVIGGGLLTVWLATGGWSQYQAQQAQSQQLKAQEQQSQMRSLELELTQEEIAAADAIAVERYQSGCTFVWLRGADGQLTDLQQDEPVVNSDTGKPVPDGTVVCDVTAIRA
jgi:hypothetical protein